MIVVDTEKKLGRANRVQIVGWGCCIWRRIGSECECVCVGVQPPRPAWACAIGSREQETCLPTQSPLPIPSQCAISGTGRFVIIAPQPWSRWLAAGVGGYPAAGKAFFSSWQLTDRLGSGGLQGVRSLVCRAGGESGSEMAPTARRGEARRCEATSDAARKL